MEDAQTLWARALSIDDDGGVLAPTLYKLERSQGAQEVVKATLDQGPRRGALRQLTRPEAVQIAEDLIPTLIRLASTAHKDLILVRRVLRGLPRGSLAREAWPVAREILGSGDWEAPLRLAELFVELALRDPLERVLEVASTGSDPNWHEMASEFAGAWDTPKWGYPVERWSTL